MNFNLVVYIYVSLHKIYPTRSVEVISTKWLTVIDWEYKLLNYKVCK